MSKGKEELIAILENHKKHITTVKEWERYSKKNDLPSSVSLIYHFRSWNELKKALNLPVFSVAAYDDEDLKKIALEHKNHLATKRKWDAYYKERGLPSSSTLLKVFGTWNNLKEFVGLSTENLRSDQYSKGDIEKILIKHADNFLNRQQWDIYAKEHRLPTYKTIKKHFSYDQILGLVNQRKKINFTKEDLIKIAKEHNIFLSSTMKSWDKYASENRLPSSHTFLKKFGSWRNAKHDIMLKI